MKYPTYTDEQLFAMTDEEFLKEKEKFDEVEKYYDNLHKEKRAKQTQIAKDIAELFSKGSLEHKYILKANPVKWYPANTYSSFQKRREAHQKELRQKETENKHRKYVEECVTYLIDAGLSLGKDFTLDNAISVAEHYHFDKLLKEVKDNLDGSLMDFDGQNCDDCGGWDGLSHRCDCGNRRVDWERGWYFTIHSDTSDIRGQAY